MDASPTSALALSCQQQKRFGCCDFKSLGAKPPVQPPSGTGVFAKISDQLVGWARAQFLSPKQNKRITLMLEGIESDMRARQQKQQQQPELDDPGASSRMLSDDNKSNNQHGKVIQHQWQQRASLHRVTLDKLRRLHPRGPLFEMVHLKSLLARLQTEQHHWIMGPNNAETFYLPRSSSDNSGGGARPFPSRPRINNKTLLPLPPGPSVRIPTGTRPTHTHRARYPGNVRTVAARQKAKFPIPKRYDAAENDDSSSDDSDEDDDLPLALVLQGRG